MTRSLCCLAFLFGGTNAIADPPSDLAARSEAEAGRPGRSGYVAEVEVSLGNLTRHGRIIVTPDGCVHFEHLDEQARRWAVTMLRPELPPCRGWDDRAPRTGPRRYVWVHVGGNLVPAEVHAPGGSVKLSEHRLLTAR